MNTHRYILSQEQANIKLHTTTSIIFLGLVTVLGTTLNCHVFFIGLPDKRYFKDTQIIILVEMWNQKYYCGLPEKEEKLLKVF